MKYFLVISFLFISLSSFCQNKDKGDFVVLFSEGTWLCNNDLSVAPCAVTNGPYLKKDSVDKLQKKLDNLNLSVKDKEYSYYMKVYNDYSYDLKKEYKFHSNKNGSSGTTISGEEYRKFPNN